MVENTGSSVVPLESLIARRRAKILRILRGRADLLASGKTEEELEADPKFSLEKLLEYSAIVRYLEELQQHKSQKQLMLKMGELNNDKQCRRKYYKK